MASSNTIIPEVVRVSPKGQTTIPKKLREKFGIETPDEVFIYEMENRIVIEPVLSPEELHGRHAGEHDEGEMNERVKNLKEEEKQNEKERFKRFRPSLDE